MLWEVGGGNCGVDLYCVFGFDVVGDFIDCDVCGIWDCYVYVVWRYYGI